MGGFKIGRLEDIPAKHKNIHGGYDFIKREFIPEGYAKQCAVSFHEVPPGKAAYPYHYHLKNEETYYIISGKGVLRTPEGEREVSTGDIMFFPADESGAHKLTNASQTETLVFLDFDSYNDIDVCFYPDSGKMGVWGKGIDRTYLYGENVDYYDGE